MTMIKMLILAMGIIGTANAALVWDNGGPAAMNTGGSNMSDTIQAGDFQLSVASDLTGITFWDLQSVAGDYTGSILWKIVADAAGAPDDSNVIGTGSATPTRTAAGTMSGFNQFQNTFSISLSAVSAGTYWLELHNGPLATNTFNDFYWTWTDLNGTNTPTARGQENGLNPVTGWTTNDNEHAFNISGVASAVLLPEPGTIVLSLGGIALLGIARIRRKA